MRVAALKRSRGVIRLAGSDLFPFLQSLLTNDVTSLSSENGGHSRTSHGKSGDNGPYTGTSENVDCVYAALLNPKGRFLHDLFLWTESKVIEMMHNGTGNVLSHGSSEMPDSCSSTTILCDVDAERKKDLITRLSRYKLRADVDIADVSDEFSVVVDLDSASVKGGGGSVQAGDRGYSDQEDHVNGAVLHLQEDPRNKFLMRRGIVSNELFQKCNNSDILTNDNIRSELSYKLHRYRLGIPEGGEEIQMGEALPLEYNLDGLNAINFSKGCYIGQELTARTHFRGVVRKRVVPLKIESATYEGSDKDDADGMYKAQNIVSNEPKRRAVGKVVAAVDAHSDPINTMRHVLGLAHMRLVHVPQDDHSFQQCEHLHLEGSTSQLSIARPNWWPTSWGREEL